MSAELAGLVSRLEAVTARLEGVAGGKRGGAPTGSASGDCNLCQSKKWSRVCGETSVLILCENSFLLCGY